MTLDTTRDTPYTKTIFFLSFQLGYHTRRATRPTTTLPTASLATHTALGVFTAEFRPQLGKRKHDVQHHSQLFSFRNLSTTNQFGPRPAHSAFRRGILSRMPGSRSLRFAGIHFSRTGDCGPFPRGFCVLSIAPAENHKRPTALDGGILRSCSRRDNCAVRVAFSRSGVLCLGNGLPG